LDLLAIKVNQIDFYPFSFSKQNIT
jgi:hypothetical protein